MTVVTISWSSRRAVGLVHQDEERPMALVHMLITSIGRTQRGLCSGLPALVHGETHGHLLRRGPGIGFVFFPATLWWGNGASFACSITCDYFMLRACC